MILKTQDETPTTIEQEIWSALENLANLHPELSFKLPQDFQALVKDIVLSTIRLSDVNGIEIERWADDETDLEILPPGSVIIDSCGMGLTLCFTLGYKNGLEPRWAGPNAHYEHAEVNLPARIVYVPQKPVE